MATVQASVSEMLVIVKAREIQRGMLAEMADDMPAAARHFLAAAHLELVLADDYVQNGQDDLAFRSRISAASCYWRGGQIEQASALFDGLMRDYPRRLKLIKRERAELSDAGR